jgi:ferrochelatase
MIEPDSPKALVLLNMGGPSSTDEVKPYLYKLFSDKDLIQIFPGGFGQKIFARIMSHFRAPASAEKYRRIGGGSPLREWTEKQARAISRDLAFSCTPFIIMRYSAPFASETLLQIKNAGIEQAVVLPLYPQYSKTTTGSGIKDFCQAVSAVHPRLQYTVIEPWYLWSDYLDVLAATVQEGLESIPEDFRSDAQVLFSAHSLPQRLIDHGDPFLTQTLRTVRGVLQRIGECHWHLCFQSRGGPAKWLEPSIKETISRLARKGHQALLIVPVSFVSDHLETLYELDLEYDQYARSLGVRHLVRSPSMNDRPDFTKAMADLINDHLEKITRKTR